ncbi:hypothetical protein NMY22_g2613 [Coprinellus aureogranulatus]|nr:hypothetical protein NMY22_g2613 [Coprinellus aureogranulatus]
MVLIYYWITTIGEEVRCIWPQPRWKLGKVLFLTARYSALIAMAGNVTYNNPHHGKLGITGCSVVFKIVQVSTIVYSISVFITLWLFLYALLECKPNYFPLVLLVLLAFIVSRYALDGMYVFSQKSVPLEPLDVVFGYPCAFTLYDRRYLHLGTIASYLSLGFVLATTAVGLVSLVVRYRRQQNGLLGVIRREGGVYLVSSLILKVFLAVHATPHTNLPDDYQVLWGLTWVFGNIFSLRMLLLLRKIDDPGTRAVISSIAFDVTVEEDQESTAFDSDTASGENCGNTESVGGVASEVEATEKPILNPTSMA